MTKLSKTHLKQLVEDSAVDPEQVDRRGYRTVKKPERLTALGFASSQAKAVPGLLIPVYAPDGTVSTHQFRPDEPRVNEDDKPIKYETPWGSRLRVDCPPGTGPDLADVAVPLWVTEGVKKADAAVSAGLCCVALAGVDAWRGSRADGTKGPLEDWASIPLRDREVRIAYDSDVMQKVSVRSALDALTWFLRREGARVLWVTLPPRRGLAEDSKVGLDDWFAKGKTAADLDEHCAEPEVSIRADGDFPEVTRDGIAALDMANRPESLFEREGHLLEYRSHGVEGVDKDRLRYLLSEDARWWKWVGSKDDKRQKVVPPPGDVVGNIMAASDKWPFPPLDRVVETPVFASDGTLRTEPGYSAASRSLYVPPEGLVIPQVSAAPGKKDVKRARALINELFVGFPFVDESDRAHAWALLMQPFARELIRQCPTPLYGVAAPKQGTGKSLLVRSALAPAVGQASAMAPPASDEEMEKRLSAAFLAADPLVFLDNVEKQVRYTSLAGALTSTQWSGRVLGKTQTIKAPITSTFALTANNPIYGPEFTRRIVPIRLDAQVEQPASRTGFRHSLPAWALENRGRLVWAACTVVSAWLAAGRPEPHPDTPTFGGFGPYRRVLGGVLTHHGVAGFLQNLPSAHDAEPGPDEETLQSILEVALGAYEAGEWFLARDLARYIFSSEAEFPSIRTETPDQVNGALGHFLRDHSNQRVSGHLLERGSSRRSSGYPWRFVKVGD